MGAGFERELVPRPWGFWAHLFLALRQPLDPLAAPRAQAMVRFILDRFDLPPGASILDLGCGAGVHALDLAHRGFRVTGLDVSDELIRHCRDQAAFEGVEAEFLVGDWGAGLGESRYDACVILGITFGYEGDEADRALAGRVARALKPGGRLIVENDNPLILEPGWVEAVDEVPGLGLLVQRRQWNPERRSFEGTFHLDTVDGRRFVLERGPGATHDEVIRVYDGDEMVDILEGEGLVVTGFWGEGTLPLEPYARASRRLIVEARKPL